MFDALVREARSKVDSALSGLAYRAAFGLFLLVALGFATASFSIWLNRQIGPEIGNLVIAAIYLVIALIVYLLVPTSSAEAQPEAVVAAQETPETAEASARMMSTLDKELLYSAATAALPIALPKLMRLIVRNLPLLAALASAIYIMTRSTSEELADKERAAEADTNDAGLAPAE